MTRQRGTARIPLLRSVSAETSPLDPILSEIDSLCARIEQASVVAKLPADLAQTIDAIAEHQEAFLVRHRDIRPAAGAYEMIATLEPAPALLAFMAAFRAWVAECGR